MKLSKGGFIMIKRIFNKRVVSLIATVAFVFSIFSNSMIKVSAFDMDYISKDGMELAYSIVNGYTKLAYSENGGADKDKVAVYSGLDITDPYILTMGGIYILTHKIDFDKLIIDNEYALKKIKDFDKYLSSVGVKNSRAERFKEYMSEEKKINISGFDTVGIYFIESDKEYSLQLMENEYVDFVIAGGEVPKTMKDLNLDEKSDIIDAELIQQYLAKQLTYEDEDEKEYIKFACDINGDKKINVLDATQLQYITKGIKKA